MVIKNENRYNFNVYELDAHNEIEFRVEGGAETAVTWLNVKEAIDLIRFLKSQVEVFNNKIYIKEIKVK